MIYPLQPGRSTRRTVTLAYGTTASAHDLLGRLIRTVSPWPDVATAGSWRRTEHFYYDGVRRIQEVRTDPMLSADDSDSALAMGIGATQQALANSEIDGGTVPAGYEQAQKGAPNPIGYATWIDREYIWGPDALDELLCQIDRFNNPWWAIQDGGGDAVALIQPVGTNDSRVVHQRLYDPYGECLEAETMYPHAELRIGHKGLFFDRLDAGVSTPQGVDIPQIVAGVFGQYQNRNRVYCPSVGRFLQRDINATALALLSFRARGGVCAFAGISAFEDGEWYGDGMNLYTYLGGNPFSHADPMGLSWDPFQMVDDFVQEHTASAAAFISQLGQNAKATAVMAATIATYLPFPASNIAGELALVALGEKTLDEAMISIGTNIVIGKVLGFAIKGITAIVGRLGSAAWSAAKYYAGKFTSALAGKVSGLAAGAKALLARAVDSAQKFARHHLLPRQYRRFFEAAGIDIEQYVVKVEGDWHRAIHLGRNALGRFTGGSWNEAWRSFWEAYPNPRPGHPSVEQVESYLNSLKAIFDLNSHIVS